MSELDKTVTATSAQGGGAGPALQAGAAFDHYVIERELGSGGMGIVYAALDTDLQRRVAIKVLRDGLPSESQERLLREARAMARLAHPNVVTVYEVGSADKRDFVAMELVDGSSLADWLRAEDRSQHEILAAFVAAGRGLAAAHAAGIVHRDFKPHNVLRSTGGRIVVTDFGLARDATDPLATTLPVGGKVTALSSSELTVPGAVLGTPAYMAPEQWSGGRLTPATDQFAFCVALWEALAGERPYRGTTIEQLREQVTRGPDDLDHTKLPRRLRAVLRRGLSPDPVKRWPSMEALLARIVPTRRRVVIAIVAVATLAAGGVVFAMTRESASACRAPALDAAKAPAAWHEQRASSCIAPAAVRARQLACLDALLARYAAQERVRNIAPKAVQERLELKLGVDPTVCARASVPTFATTFSDDAIAALALTAGDVEPAIDHRARSSTDPCARLVVAIHDSLTDGDHRACADDALQAELAVWRFIKDSEGFGDVELTDRARAIHTNLDATGRRHIGMLVDFAAAMALKKRRRLAEAITMFEAGLAAAPEHIDVGFAGHMIETYLDRGLPADLANVHELVATWRPIAQRLGHGNIVMHLDWLDATAQWLQGDFAGARPRLVDLHARDPVLKFGVGVKGNVVDASGKSVAGADVATGIVLHGDPLAIATPMLSAAHSLRMFELAKTDASGAFAFAKAPPCFGIVVAQRGNERSKPVPVADDVKLVLEPTTRVRGRVDLGGRSGTFIVGVAPVSKGAIMGAASVNALVGPDHRFEITGVIGGDALISVGEGSRSFYNHVIQHKITIDPKRPPDDVVLELPAGRELRVLIRGGGSAGTPVFAVAGKLELKTFGDLMKLPGATYEVATAEARPIAGKIPAELAATYREGDLLAHFPSAPIGPTTICTMQITGNCSTDMPLHCSQIGGNAALVVVTPVK